MKFLGVDPATGDAIYEDIDGDGIINDQDGQIIGNAQPNFIGGINNIVYYKNFDLSMQFEYHLISYNCWFKSEFFNKNQLKNERLEKR